MDKFMKNVIRLAPSFSWVFKRFSIMVGSPFQRALAGGCGLGTCLYDTLSAHKSPLKRAARVEDVGRTNTQLKLGAKLMKMLNVSNKPIVFNLLKTNT